MKLRIVEYHLNMSADELKEQAAVEDRGVVEMKEVLLARLPKTKLQVWTVFNDDRRSEWLDVPTEVVPMTIDELENL